MRCSNPYEQLNRGKDNLFFNTQIQNTMKKARKSNRNSINLMKCHKLANKSIGDIHCVTIILCPIRFAKTRVLNDFWCFIMPRML